MAFVEVFTTTKPAMMDAEPTEICCTAELMLKKLPRRSVETTLLIKACAGKVRPDI